MISHQHAGDRPERWRAGCTLRVLGCPVLVDGQLADSSIDILARLRRILAVTADGGSAGFSRGAEMFTGTC